MLNRFYNLLNITPLSFNTADAILRQYIRHLAKKEPININLKDTCYYMNMQLFIANNCACVDKCDVCQEVVGGG